MSDLREELADLEHQQWSGWMDYLFSKAYFNDDGEAMLSLESIERWNRQRTTPYAQLSEAEKNSDRAEADKVLMIMSNHMRAQAS